MRWLPLNRPLVPFTAYRGRRLALATRHGKERATARPFRAALGLELVLAAGFDTDALGTFSGERPRPADAATTCRLKAEAAIAHTGLELGLASEGSFGPMPGLPFLAGGAEWMTFIDQGRGLVIQEQLLARRTNFDQRSVRPGDDLEPWLQRVGFPRHGLIVRPQQALDPLCLKDLSTREQLVAAIDRCSRASSAGLAVVETDMRAHRNPTRMATIRRLAFQLARRLATPCPACAAPGWGLIDTVPGLPCGWCGRPSALVARERFGCGSCGHIEEQPRRDGLLAADPAHCDACNP